MTAPRFVTPGRGTPTLYMLPGGSHTQPSCSDKIGLGPPRVIKLKPSSSAVLAGWKSIRLIRPAPQTRTQTCTRLAELFTFIFLKQQHSGPDVEVHWFCHFFWLHPEVCLQAQAAAVIPGMQASQGFGMNKSLLSMNAAALGIILELLREAPRSPVSSVHTLDMENSPSSDPNQTEWSLLCL